MEENDLTPEESFNIINKAVANLRINYRENGKMFLLWGWILTLASLSNFLLLKILHAREKYELMGPLSIANWIGFVLVGFILLYFWERKTSMEKKVYSYLDGYIRKLWQVSGASMFIATFISFKLDIVPPIIILLIGGIATTITGLLIKFKPLTVGGISFFVFSVASAFVNIEYISLLTAAAIICGYLIPGYMLKWAKE